VRGGATGFLVQDLSQWVDQLAALIESPDLRLTLGRAARRDVEKFDVHLLGARLCDLILGCLGQGNGGQPAQWNLALR
jgi:glycosyltransferase involved in cell wall biosynthesis